MERKAFTCILVVLVAISLTVTETKNVLSVAEANEKLGNLFAPAHVFMGADLVDNGYDGSGENSTDVPEPESTTGGENNTDGPEPEVTTTDAAGVLTSSLCATLILSLGVILGH